MKRIFFVAAVMTMLSNVNVNAQFGAGAAQQQNAEPKAPELEYVLRLNVALGQAFPVGDTGKGVRTVIPITGGTTISSPPSRDSASCTRARFISSDRG